MRLLRLPFKNLRHSGVFYLVIHKPKGRLSAHCLLQFQQSLISTAVKLVLSGFQ